MPLPIPIGPTAKAQKATATIPRIALSQAFYSIVFLAREGSLQNSMIRVS
jgi:hypothetical protein